MESETEIETMKVTDMETISGDGGDDDGGNEDELIRQKEILEKLQNSRRLKFNAMPIARVVCRANNCRNLTELASRPNGVFGNYVDAWAYMKQHTFGVEVGSVRRHDGSQPREFQVDVRHEDAAEKQRIACFLSPQNKELCYFLDNPAVDGADMDRICIYSCIARHRWSNFPITVDVRLNYYHKGINALQDLEKHDHLFKAAGATRGTFMSIPQTPIEGEEIQSVPIPTLKFGPTDPAFTQTMALVHESNLMNGIVQIPHEACVEANLPVFRGTPKMSEDILSRMLDSLNLDADAPAASEEEAREKILRDWERNWEERTKDKDKIECFYAVPIMHVLAWPFHSDDFAQQHHVRAEMLRFRPPPKADGTPSDPVLLYYLVADVYFRALLKSFREDWMDKVDMRPLQDVAFEFVPALAGYKQRYPHIPPEVEAVKGIVATRAHISYMAPRANLTAEEIRNMAPTLAPGFKSSHDWVNDAARQQMAIDRHMKNRS